MRPVRPLLVILLVALTGCASATTPRATPAATTQHPSVAISDQPQVVFTWATQSCSDEEHPDLPVRAFRDAQGQVS
jgi:type IV pilus biogenesis protein CpaD/CtpE